MNTMTRRRFVAAAGSMFAGAPLRSYGQRRHVALAVPHDAAGVEMPVNFGGLSYEVRQLANPEFFSVKNAGLIRRFRDLAPHGVLRLGGNTSEFATWKPSPNTPDPKRPEVREVEGEPKALYYLVTPAAVRNLRAFLDATEWTCIYGIGMGTNTPDRAAAEAEFAATTLGGTLEYFQIGNEPDLYGHYLRDPKTWNAEAYIDEWLLTVRAIQDRVPHARFALPDVSSHIEWLTEIAERWTTIKNPPRLAALTHHYYFGGPATNPDVSINNLLKPETMGKVQRIAEIANAAASKIGVHVRMSEGNTCYLGGKPGVSDVFGAALWAAEYSLLLASNGYMGVNLHGGTGNSVATSVGGFLLGDRLLQEQGESNQQIETHPHPFYTPIATFGAEYELEPVGYGLKFAGTLGGGRFYITDFAEKLTGTGVNASGYAVKLADQRTAVTILNKDAREDVEVTIDFGPDRGGPVQSEVLHAPTLDSREVEITKVNETIQIQRGRYNLIVPHATGMRVTIP